MRGSVEQLLFYHGFSPRQLLACRQVCKRWATLLCEDRFWWRHYAALPKRLLALLPPLQQQQSLRTWYMGIAQRIHSYFDCTSLVLPRDQQLWEAMLLVTAPDSVRLKSMGGPGVQCWTRIEYPDTAPLAVALTIRVYTAQELALRALTTSPRRRRRKRSRETLEVYTWCDQERRDERLPASRLSECLLGVLLDGRPLNKRAPP